MTTASVMDSTSKFSRIAAVAKISAVANSSIIFEFSISGLPVPVNLSLISRSSLTSKLSMACGLTAANVALAHLDKTFQLSMGVCSSILAFVGYLPHVYQFRG